jgi:broad specificity phosphatase PhoE
VPADLWATWRSDVRWVPPGGESLVSLGERVRAACEDLVVEAAERDVVVVSHVSPIKAAVAWALGVGDEVAWRLWVAPASVTRIGIGRGGVPSLRGFNDLGHLR